jgi:hypothetical protein
MRDFLASRRPTPAMAVAFVALLAALSGTAVALPGKNSVDSGDIKNGQVKAKDLAPSSVTSAKVKNNALTGADVLDDSLTGADIGESTLGKVPSASSADTANSAATATTAANATGIADNVVTGAKVADGSLAAADVATITGVVTIDYGSIPAGVCATNTPDLNVDVNGDVILVTPDDTIQFANGGLTVHASDSSVNDLIRINACNVTGGAIDPPAADFAYMIFQR